MALMRSTLLTGSLFAAATLGSACVVSVDSQAQIVREEKRFTVSGTPDLRLTTFDGAIEIQSWDKPDVAIDIEKRGSTKEAVDGLEIVSSQSGNRIEIGVGRGDSSRRVLGKKPMTVETMVEFSNALRGLVRGDKVTYDEVETQIPWADGYEIPIWIAAYGPKALKAAGEAGDGLVLQMGEPALCKWFADQAIAALRKLK